MAVGRNERRRERPIGGGWYVIERGGETCVLVCARDLCGGHPAARFLYRCARVCGEGLLWRQKGMYTVSACSRGCDNYKARPLSARERRHRSLSTR